MKFEYSKGKRYEDTYGGWLYFFSEMAREPRTVEEAPACWYPFIRYLGGDVLRPQPVFPEDYLVHNPLQEAVNHAILGGRLRALVEMYSTLRPELADALYKSDVEWKFGKRLHATQSEFNVTNNGSFHRPEVLDFIEKVHTLYKKPEHVTTAVLVPCAADKPYPAPLHATVQRILPKDAHQVIITGVLGVVPQETWDEMPNYDSGIPNQWRVMQEVVWYFKQFRYKKIVMYCDFYNEAIHKGLTELKDFSGLIIRQVTPFSSKYLNLKDPRWLSVLEETLRS